MSDGWTLGMIDYLCRLDAAADALRGQGMVYVVAKLKALNYLTCWCSDTKATRWPMVNRQLWRLKALYEGGDCFTAGFPGALPHQPLWLYRQPKAPRHRDPVSPLLPYKLAYRRQQRAAAYRTWREKKG